MNNTNTKENHKTHWTNKAVLNELMILDISQWNVIDLKKQDNGVYFSLSLSLSLSLSRPVSPFLSSLFPRFCVPTTSLFFSLHSSC